MMATGTIAYAYAPDVYRTSSKPGCHQEPNKYYILLPLPITYTKQYNDSAIRHHKPVLHFPWTTYIPYSTLAGSNMQNRQFPRIENSNMLADISDGKRFFSGYVSNLSRSGLCIEDIPQRMDHKARKVSVVLSGKEGTFKMVTCPRWSWQRGSSKSLGLEILNAPVGWAEFVMQHEPVSQDPWAEIRL